MGLFGKTATAQKLDDLKDTFREHRKDQKHRFEKHESDGKQRFDKLEEQIDEKIGSCPYNGDIKLIKKITYTIIMLILALIVKSWVVPLITK